MNSVFSLRLLVFIYFSLDVNHQEYTGHEMGFTTFFFVRVSVNSTLAAVGNTREPTRNPGSAGLGITKSTKQPLNMLEATGIKLNYGMDARNEEVALNALSRKH